LSRAFGASIRISAAADGRYVLKIRGTSKRIL